MTYPHEEVLPASPDPNPDLVDVVLSDKTVALLKSRKHGCFLCAWILEDAKKNGSLTGHPFPPTTDGFSFPVSAKVAHVNLEKGRVRIRVLPRPLERWSGWTAPCPDLPGDLPGEEVPF